MPEMEWQTLYRNPEGDLGWEATRNDWLPSFENNHPVVVLVRPAEEHSQ